MNKFRKNLNKLKVVNIKISFDGSGNIIFYLAKPCYDCRESLIQYGITGIYFSTETNFVYEKINDMISTFSSSSRVKRE